MRWQVKWIFAVCAVFVFLGIKTAWSASMWPDHSSASMLMMDPANSSLIHTYADQDRGWFSPWPTGGAPILPDQPESWIDLDGYLMALDLPAVVPLPPAILLFLTALGALFGVNRLRKNTSTPG